MDLHVYINRQHIINEHIIYYITFSLTNPDITTHKSSFKKHKYLCGISQYNIQNTYPNMSLTGTEK